MNKVNKLLICLFCLSLAYVAEAQTVTPLYAFCNKTGFVYRFAPTTCAAPCVPDYFQKYCMPNTTATLAPPSNLTVKKQ